MNSRAKVLGQPLNPLLTVLPLGILGSAVLVDLAALISGSHLFGAIAHADMGVGLLAAVGAFCAILIDLMTAQSGSLTRQALTVVATALGSMIAVFMIIWSVRLDGDRSANGFMFLLEIAALVAGGFGAGLTRRLFIGRGIPTRYLGAGRYIAAAPSRAADAVRRGTVPLSRLMR